MANDKQTALVTGGNRGIGLEVCRQLGEQGMRVVLTARDAKLGEQAARELARDGADVIFESLDVSSEKSVAECAARLKRAGVRVDALINNAAIYAEQSAPAIDVAQLEQHLHANLTGAVRCCAAFVPAMLKAGYGRIVNVSSGSGAFAEGLEGPAPYCITKAALNAFTVKLAQQLRGDVKANAVCPGWVRTRMGGRAAPRSVEKGAETVVWLATLPASGPSGGFFRDKKRIAW